MPGPTASARPEAMRAAQPSVLLGLDETGARVAVRTEGVGSSRGVGSRRARLTANDFGLKCAHWAVCGSQGRDHDR